MTHWHYDACVRWTGGEGHPALVTLTHATEAPAQPSPVPTEEVPPL